MMMLTRSVVSKVSPAAVVTRTGMSFLPAPKAAVDFGRIRVSVPSLLLKPQLKMVFARGATVSPG